LAIAFYPEEIIGKHQTIFTKEDIKREYRIEIHRVLKKAEQMNVGDLKKR
jgi:hypothetical protein